ncbi:unnamed protein product [Ilex paraguariensis]|uniref:Uncharacterized protein n=1 Tax=Ilex paraguariensis TaxID=185542 RepID=A0ABC8UXW3_9AQUA
MEMEVVIPVHNMDFDFASARSSPYPSAPSTPKPFGHYYFSAPTSPTRLSEFYRDLDDLLNNSSTKTGGDSSTVPVEWKEKASSRANNHEDDFAFDFSAELERTSLSADELFDGGVIRPLKPPTPARNQKSPVMSPRSPISQGKRIFRGVFSPKHKTQPDPFAIAVENTQTRTPDHERGRERSSSFSSESSGRRATRSLSPLRVSQYPWEEEHQLQHNTKQSSTSSKPSSSSSICPALSSSSSLKGYRKWKLKDFFLFRSASEGRAADKDPLRKYTALFRKNEDVKNSSFRAIDSPGFGSSSRRKGPISAHELHYKMNRAVSEDLKKKTFLPYKQGILGRLAFNPAVHALANGFGFSRK